MGGRDGRAGDAPLDRAGTAAGVWTRAVTSARLDRLHQVDGALAAAAVRDAPGFVPVLVTQDGTAPAEPEGRIEIALGPAVVRVGADVDAAALRRVLEVVRGLA